MATAPFLDVRRGARMNIVAGPGAMRHVHALLGALRGRTGCRCALGERRRRHVGLGVGHRRRTFRVRGDALEPGLGGGRRGGPGVGGARRRRAADRGLDHRHAGAAAPVGLGGRHRGPFGVQVPGRQSGAALAGVLVSRRDMVGPEGPDMLRQRLGHLRQIDARSGLRSGPVPTSAAAVLQDLRSLRGRVDRMSLGADNFDESTLNLVTGQSGIFLSPHYMDQWGAWYGGSTFKFPYSNAAVEQHKKHEMTLQPK